MTAVEIRVCDRMCVRMRGRGYLISAQLGPEAVEVPGSYVAPTPGLGTAMAHRMSE